MTDVGNGIAPLRRKQNPIIFARTETEHIPERLSNNVNVKDAYNTIYSTNSDGSLKKTPLYSIEEEGDDELTEKKKSVRNTKCTCYLVVMGVDYRFLYLL